MLVRPYEMPWRRAYEMFAAAAWLGCLLALVYLAGRGAVPLSMALVLAWGNYGTQLVRFFESYRWPQRSRVWPICDVPQSSGYSG